VGVYRSFRIPKELVRSITITGTPLLLNETLWAAGQAMLLQCYSVRGIATVSAMNISGIAFNTFSVLYFSMGTTIAILIGHRLGEGEREKAMDDAKKMIAFSTLLGIISGILIAICSLFFPSLYNTTDEVRALASSFIITVAVSAPIQAILNASYFTLRSGGKTLLTLLFDSAYVWCFTIPLSFCMINFTTLPVEWVYFMCYNSDIIRCVIGIILVGRGIWLNDLTKKH
jgi:Na+-driven multidrug efflux pump